MIGRRENRRIADAADRLLKGRARTEQAQELLGPPLARGRPQARPGAAAHDEGNDRFGHRRSVARGVNGDGAATKSTVMNCPGQAADHRARRSRGRYAGWRIRPRRGAGSAAPKRAAQLRVLRQTIDRIGQGGGVVGGHEQGIDAGARDGAAAGNVGRNDRAPARRGLEQALGQSLAPRRQHRDMRGRPDLADVGDVAEQLDAAALLPGRELGSRDRVPDWPGRGRRQ